MHSAAAMVASLERKKVSAAVRKRNDGGWPVSVAGRRPPNRLDAETPSRHRHADKPASLVLLFNCHNAAFEITAWSVVDALRQASGRAAVLTWGKDVATIRVHPWLAYGCSVGARFLVRKVGAPSGQCATVQRILADDRVVARIDGFARSDGVKGETIIDLAPSSVVRTTSVGYPRDTKVLLMHNNKFVDASVLYWLGGTDWQEGSRHMLNVKPVGATTGTHVWYDLNMYNHVLAGPDVSAEKYENARNQYCSFLQSHEDKVEDAITGNSLQIRDQLIFMALHNVPGGNNPPNMSRADVPTLVKELVTESPKRTQGMHVAQPVLCRAGPGTGKTWMIKQSLFLLAENLSGDNAGGGVRLMPAIVFVQRIVRLLRELGEDPSVLLQDPNGMMRWYISSEFSDRKEERALLLQAYEMRALVILVDGVDEAAGMRDIVEAFVHYELVTSGNRLVVTSRPEGVDLDDYKTRFVVMNLLELSQEQQRNVIQMQLQGNAFFEHLVNIAECRKMMDASYRSIFKSEHAATRSRRSPSSPPTRRCSRRKAAAEAEALAAEEEAEDGRAALAALKKEAAEKERKKVSGMVGGEGLAARQPSMVSGEDDEEAGSTFSYVRRRLAAGQPHRSAGVVAKVDLKAPRTSKFVRTSTPRSSSRRACTHRRSTSSTSRSRTCRHPRRSRKSSTAL